MKQGRVLYLNEEETKYLIDLLDMWIDGHEGAMDDTIEDDSIPDTDTFIELSGGLVTQRHMAEQIRGRLTE